MPDPIQKFSLSRYASRVLEAHPAWRAELDDPAPFAAATMAAALAGTSSESEALFKRRLRELRQRVLLRVMARDLSGRAALEEVCETMSGLAQAAVSACLAWICAQDESGLDLAVLAMGKLGGGELNV